MNLDGPSRKTTTPTSSSTLVMGLHGRVGHLGRPYPTPVIQEIQTAKNPLLQVENRQKRGWSRPYAEIFRSIFAFGPVYGPREIPPDAR
jgi:hypothetical protein